MILSEITKNQNVTAEELSELVGINVRNIKKNISRLKAAGYIVREGSKKRGFWRVR